MSKWDVVEDARGQEVFMNRLRMLESNMNRLVNQHQVLAPLIDLVHLIPEVHKHKQSLQTVQRRLQTISTDLAEFLDEVKASQYQSAHTGLRELNTEVAEAKKKLKQLEEASKKAEKEHVYRAKIRANAMNKGIEGNLEELKKDVVQFTNEFKQSLSSQFNRITQSEAIETYLNQRFQESEHTLDDHIQNLKREMGLLQCEVEFLRDQQLRNELAKTKDKEGDGKALATLEQQFYLDNFISFEQSNVDRLKYEFDVLQNYLKRFSTSNVLQKKSLEIQYLKDRYYSVLNQVQGTKTKRTQELMKLQNKLERLSTLMEPSQIKNQEMEKLSKQLKQAKDIGVKHMKLLEQQASGIDSRFKEIQKAA